MQNKEFEIEKTEGIPLAELRDKLLQHPQVRRGYEEQQAVVAVARLIRSTRLKAGVSPKELAQRLQTSQSEILGLEGGTGRFGPTVSMLNRVAHALGGQVVFGLQEGRAAATAGSLNESIHTVIRLARRVAKTPEELKAIDVIESVRWVA